MQIARDAVVLIHYTLKNGAGEVLDSSAGHDLEEALEGKVVGDKVLATIPPEKAYGVKDAGLVQQVPRRAFQGEVRAGMQFTASTEAGPRTVVVTRVQGDMVTVDGNHPLAGETLHFDVEVTEVRVASEEELTHGHVHGPGGHHH